MLTFQFISVNEDDDQHLHPTTPPPTTVSHRIQNPHRKGSVWLLRHAPLINRKLTERSRNSDKCLDHPLQFDTVVMVVHSVDRSVDRHGSTLHPLPFAPLPTPTSQPSGGRRSRAVRYHRGQGDCRRTTSQPAGQPTTTKEKESFPLEAQQEPNEKVRRVPIGDSRGFPIRGFDIA